MKTVHATFAFATLLALPAFAQKGADEPQLPRARATFRAADYDRDGRIDADERREIGLPDGDGPVFDLDGDDAWCEGEFLLYYRRLLKRTGRPVALDLDLEAGIFYRAVKDARDTGPNETAVDRANEALLRLGHSPEHATPEDRPFVSPQRRVRTSETAPTASEPEMSDCEIDVEVETGAEGAGAPDTSTSAAPDAPVAPTAPAPGFGGKGAFDVFGRLDPALGVSYDRAEPALEPTTKTSASETGSSTTKPAAPAESSTAATPATPTAPAPAESPTAPAPNPEEVARREAFERYGAFPSEPAPADRTPNEATAPRTYGPADAPAAAEEVAPVETKPEAPPDPSVATEGAPVETERRPSLWDLAQRKRMELEEAQNTPDPAPEADSAGRDSEGEPQGGTQDESADAASPSDVSGEPDEPGEPR